MSGNIPQEYLNVTINEKQKQFRESEFHSSIAMYVTKEQEDMLNDTELKIRHVVQSSKTEDKFGKRLRNFTKNAIKDSSWLKDRLVPTKGKMSDQMNDATTKFGITQLSDSQKTKRGKKFKKKAEQQARMINLMQQCHWERKEALNDLLQHGKNARIGADVVRSPEGSIMNEKSTWYHDTESDTFLDKVGDDIDDVSLQMKDLAFYYEHKRSEGGTDDLVESNTLPLMRDVGTRELKSGVYSGSSPEITSRHYKPLELIADPETREKGYMQVISELEELDLSQFDYKDNESFMKNVGDNSFVKRYATLKAFSHAGEMIQKLGKGALGEVKYQALKVKAAVVSDIFADYESRAILLQSPYYVLLAGKDFDSFDEKNLTERIKRTEDDRVKLYLIALLERKKQGGFKRGSKANDILKKKMKSLSKDMKNEDKVNGDILIKQIQSPVVLEKNRQETFTRHDKVARNNFFSTNTLLDSIEFRTKHHLEISNEKEKALLKEFEQWKEKQPENTQVTLEAWIKIKREQVKNGSIQACKEADEAYVTSFDPMAAAKSIFIQYVNAVNIKLKNDEKFRLDPRGDMRREHMKKYANNNSYNESMLDEDVENLINNLLVDDELNFRDIDYSLFDKDMVTWIKAYSLYNRFLEQPGGDSERCLEECRIRMKDIKDLIKTHPENEAELKKELEELEQDEIDISIRKEALERRTLKIKNKTPALFQYWNFTKELNCLNTAKRMLEKEPDGSYKEDMLRLLLERENELKPKQQECIQMFHAVINSTQKIADPFTKKETFILQTLSEYNDQIMSLHKLDTDEARAEMMNITNKVRELVLSVDDEEAVLRYNIPEKVTAKIMAARESGSSEKQ